MKRMTLVFLVLLVSVMSLTAFAVKASAVETENNAENAGTISLTGEGLSFVYEDGSLTLRIDADRLADILEERAVTKDDLLSFVPDILVELVKERDPALIKDFLVESFDPALLTDLIPSEVVTDYLTFDF